MRIAFIVDRFPSLSETFILNQITGLIDQGHEVDIFCDRPGNMIKLHPEIEQYQLLKRRYFQPIPRLPWRILQGFFLLLANIPKAPQILATINLAQERRACYGEQADFLKPLYLALPFIGQNRYDIVHCHYGRNGLKAALLRDLGFIDGKIIVAFHGNDISRYLRIHGERVYDYLFTQADLLLPISDHWQKKLIALGCNPHKIKVHHMGIETEKFAPLNAAKQRDASSTTTIVTVARLVEKKGLSYAIEAIAKILHRHPQLKVRYWIVGDGVLRPQLEEQIARLQVAQHIKLLGWQERQKVYATVSQADIVVAPSIVDSNGDSEGIPVSLMEAMALEIPVISTYHSGIPELVEDGISGFLVPEKDVDALSERLEQLLTQPELGQKMGRAGRAKVLAEYNQELLCDRLCNIYQELVS